MILDQCINARAYLGISAAMDSALHFLETLKPEQLEVNTRVELSGTDAFYSVGEINLCPRPMKFEFHRRYIDIHVPITGEEEIALCSAGDQPRDVEYSMEKDIGFFEGKPVNRVRVPAGWFCMCFLDDAHVPSMSERERMIVKVIMKIKA